MTLDEEMYEKGYKVIAGIDEVGRGCLSGDVVACAVVMPKDNHIDGVMDSKKLSEKKRIALDELIRKDAIAIGIGQVDPQIIDEINIKKATRLAMKKAVLDLKDKHGNQVLPDLLLIDAENIDLDIEQENIIKGDELSYSISCASIVAKVYRDNLCQTWDQMYPGYNIKKHKGYGTKEHRENILKLGPSDNHRLTFLKKILQNK